MYKIFGLVLSLFVTLSAHADDVRDFQKVNSNKAIVSIETEDKDGTQAAAYLDGAENPQFINMLLDDSQSRLSLLKQTLEMEHCQKISATPDGWIDGCGAVEVTEIIRTSFGRGGWMEGASGYTFFVGFRSAGTGHYFESTHMVTFTEHVVANTDANMKYLGSVTKTLELGKIVKLPVQ